MIDSILTANQKKTNLHVTQKSPNAEMNQIQFVPQIIAVAYAALIYHFR